jgi:acetyl esterase/lipase
MIKLSLVLLTVFMIIQAASAEDTISIWPEEANGIKVNIEEKTKSENDRYFNIFNPTLQVIKPEESNGSAVIICPGGAYSFICTGKEGLAVAAEFVKSGVTCFILKYRLPKTPNAKFEHPVPLSDVQRAIKYVRFHASQWNLEPNKIGVMGFSAGGHLASMAMTWFDKPVYTKGKIEMISCRPDFAILVYPVINTFTKGIAHGCVKKLVRKDQIKSISSELNVTSDCPPTFIVHSKDDRVVIAKNSILMYDALMKVGVPTKLKLYEKGSHGFGVGRVGTDSMNWILDCKVWLKSHSLIF